jgi:hypothetical protein
MKNFLQIASGVDVLPLLHALYRRPELWKEDTYLRDYPQGPFGEVETIMLRFPEKRVFDLEADLERYKTSNEQHESIDYPAYKLLPEARALIMPLMARVGGERLGRCMINKVKPGGRIFPHVDTKAHTDYYSRHHIVLQTNQASVFRAGDEAPTWQAGDVFWFDNSEEHEVQNQGSADRIHLVVDIRCSARA